jgi:pimeloyl-ACP methyl ester carboxylesterase
MTSAIQRLSLPDGRELEVASRGNPEHPTLVFHHGTPGSVLLADGLIGELLEHLDVFVVTTSRAGYGTSSRLEGRTVASVAEDIRFALDSLGRSSYAVMGWSGGGPHALACAALDAPRCVGVVTLAGVVPTDVDFDWTEGMGEANLEEFALAQKGGPEYEAMMAEVGEKFATADESNVVAFFDSLLSTEDLAVLSDRETRTAFAAGIRHGFAQGWHGFYDDDRAFFSPWGFDVAPIAVPTFVYFGDEDLMVPPTHGEWLLAHINGAVKRFYPGEGHVSVVTKNISTIANDLKSILN